MPEKKEFFKNRLYLFFICLTILGMCMAVTGISVVNAETWFIQTVDSSANVGYYTSLSIDSSGKIHIAYRNEDATLNYITNASGNWVTITLDSMVNSSISLAIDSSDKIHISYWDSPNSALRYITNVSGSWIKETVDNNEYEGRDSSIAIDSSDKVHISYCGGLEVASTLKYATNSTGSWVINTLDAEKVGWCTSIALDSSENIHISYRDWENNDLKYITNKSGSWVNETLDSNGSVGIYTSIAIDSFDKVHISYASSPPEPGSGKLKYATNATGTWVTQNIDNGAADISMVLDTSDKVHISYGIYRPDVNYRNLKYATNSSDSWVTETLDSAGNARYTSIDINLSGNIHISYMNYLNRTLKYITSYHPTSTIIGGPPISTGLSEGDYICFGGKDWIFLDDSTRYIILKGYDATTGSGCLLNCRKFDDSNDQAWGYGGKTASLNTYLNTDFYNSLGNDKDFVATNGEWSIETGENESAYIWTGKVALLTKTEFEYYKENGPDLTGTSVKVIQFPSADPNMNKNWWLLTPGVGYSGCSPVRFIATEDIISASDASSCLTDRHVRPTVHLQSGLYIEGGDGTSENPKIITRTPTSPTNQANATFTVAGADVVAYKYKLDNGSYSAETVIGIQISLNDLNEGSHTVSVVGKDSAGNWQGEGSATTTTWTVDLTAPIGPIVINNGSTGCTSRDVTITLNSGDASLMSFSNDNFLFSDWEAYKSSKDWTLTDGNGNKTVYVKYQDVAGNISTATFSSIVLDTVPPDSPTIINIGNISENEPVFDWENVAETSYYIIEYANNSNFTGSTIVSNITTSNYTVTSELDDGTWYWRIKAIDASGNIGAWSLTGSFNIDTTAYCGANPLQPILLSPTNNIENVSRTPNLTTDTFQDPGNCSTHFKTRWQISEQDDFSALTLNANTFDNLTTFEVIKSVLKPNTTFYWRVKYWGSSGNKSEWSNVFSFTTEVENEDADDNGIPDSQAVPDTLDLDGDNIFDNSQTNLIKSIKAQKGNNNFGIRPQDSQITEVKILDADSIPDDGNKPSQVPYGLLSFRLEVPNLGDTTTVKIYLSRKAPNNAIWIKYDPVNGWLDYSDHAVFNDDRDEVTLELKDGGYGDNDHTENGVIIDPGGIGVSADSDEIDDASDSGGIDDASDSSSGCFIATAAYGSPMQQQVKILQEFRDHFMITNPVGRIFVRLYYSYSPPVANFIKDNDSLRSLVSLSLLPIVGIGWVTIKLGLLSTLAITLFLLFGIMYFSLFRKKLKLAHRVIGISGTKKQMSRQRNN